MSLDPITITFTVKAVVTNKGKRLYCGTDVEEAFKIMFEYENWGSSIELIPVIQSKLRPGAKAS
jgi:hypothetical protein